MNSIGHVVYIVCTSRYMLSESLLCCNGQILMYVSPPVQCFCRTFVNRAYITAPHLVYLYSVCQIQEALLPREKEGE